MQQMAEAEGLTLEDYCRQHIETMGEEEDAVGFAQATCHTQVIRCLG